MRTVEELINKLLELEKEFGTNEVGILNENYGVEHIVCTYDDKHKMIVIY